ncbi:MAG TPA: hypothetical protein VHE61_11830 [Opitutaceae bacterium]|nr:hypothetical protein [Opitutaceae bacterium]
MRALESKRLVTAAEYLAGRGPVISVTIFSGYFGSWHHNVGALDRELHWSVALRRRIRGRKIRVALMALSTDPASRWALGEAGMQSRVNLRAIVSGCMDEQSVLNNLLLHRPTGLRPQAIRSFLQCWHLDDLLFEEFPPLWHGLTASLRFDEYRKLIGSVAVHCYHGRGERVYPAATDMIPFVLLQIFHALARGSRASRAARRVMRELVELYHASVLALRSVRTPVLAVGETEVPRFLVLNPHAIRWLQYDFAAIWDALRRNGSIARRNVESCANTRGAYAYLVLPVPSRKLPRSEVEQLRRFDGITATEKLISHFADELYAPTSAIRGRILQHCRDRVLLSA